RLALDRQPVQKGLLQRRRARKLLREQFPYAIEERIARRQKGPHIAAEQFADRLSYQLKRQRVAAIESRHCADIGRRADDVHGLQDRLAGVVVQAAKRECAHRRYAAFVRPELGRLLAASEEQTAVVRTLAQRVHQLAILGVARAIGARQYIGLDDRLEIVEDQQAAPLAKQLNEQCDLVGYLVR